MNQQEYNERSTQREGGGWKLPSECFTDQEFDIEKTIVFLSELGMIGVSVDGRIVFHPRFEDEWPDIHKLFLSIHKDSEQAQMDEWVEAGLAFQEINMDAELIYKLADGTRLMNSWGMID